MSILLKIINQSPSTAFLRIDSGKGYDFRWDNTQRGFIYAPTSQTEIEEIYNAIAAYGSSWVIVPVMGGAPAPAIAAPSAPQSPDDREEQAAYVAGLQATINSSADTIAKLRAAAKTDAETIDLLRADLKAQQDKAVSPAKAKAKPGPKPRAKSAPFGTADATPPATADDLPADV